MQGNFQGFQKWQGGTTEAHMLKQQDASTGPLWGTGCLVWKHRKFSGHGRDCAQSEHQEPPTFDQQERQDWSWPAQGVRTKGSSANATGRLSRYVIIM